MVKAVVSCPPRVSFQFAQAVVRVNNVVDRAAHEGLVIHVRFVAEDNRDLRDPEATLEDAEETRHALSHASKPLAPIACRQRKAGMLSMPS